MAYTARHKVLDFSRGAATGGVMAAGITIGVRDALPVLAKAAPVAAKAVRAMVSAEAAAVVMGGGALYGVYNAHKNQTNVVAGAMLGSLLIFPKKAAAAEAAADAAPTQNMAGETPDQVRQRLGKKFGGSPNDLKLAAANDRANMAKAKTQQQRDAYERRALLAEQEYERQTGQHIGPTMPVTQPAAPASVASSPAPAQQSTIDKVLAFGRELISGKTNDKSDPFEQRRDAIKTEIAREQKNADIEYQKNPGTGPNQRAHSEKLDKLRDELAKIDREERDANAGNRALMLSLGAAVAGGLVGNKMGKAAIASAEAAAGAAGRGVESVARGAAKLVNRSPKGLIHGTIEGDKAAAAVAVASKQLNAPQISAIAAYGVPAVSGTVAAGSIGYATAHPEDPLATALRTEGYASGAMALFGIKGGMVARGVRAVVSPQALSGIQSAEQRLVREAKTGASAVVTQARSRLQSIRTSNRANVAAVEAKAGVGVAQHEAQSKVAVAGVRGGAKVAVAEKVALGSGQIAAERIKGRVGVVRADARSSAQVARHEGSAAAVAAGRKVGVAKANAATAVAKAETVTRSAQQEAPKYKDTWMDNRGRTYHRRSQSVRHRSAPLSVNATVGSSSRAANGN